MLRLSLFVVSVLVMVSVQSARAEERPSPAERARIEDLLRAKGFAKWGKIERDHGRWEIDDARHADGFTYDLELDVGTLALVKLERD